jgi:hypothetical protein
MGYTGSMSIGDEIAQALTGPYPKTPLEEHIEMHQEMMKDLGFEPDPLTIKEIHYAHKQGG